MENIMKPEPHKIVSVIRQTAASLRFVWHVTKILDMDSFPAVSAENRRGSRSLSVEKDRVMWNLLSVKSDD